MSTRPLPPLLIVSGMSGSGTSLALKTFEDLDFYCVDNLPAELLPAFVQTVGAHESAPTKLAVGIDVRNRRDLGNLPDWLSAVGSLGFDPRLLFFDTADDVVLRRYADTRRRHPLSQLGLSLADAISLERQVLKPLRQIADAIVDTSAMNVHQLRRHITTEYGLGTAAESAPRFETFAYPPRVPGTAGFVFDARVLPNPHWNAALRPLSGRDAGIREYLEAQEDVQLFAKQIGEFLDTWLPRLQANSTRSYATVAFGCTGGRHRSVYLAERFAAHARAQGWDEVAVHHRELD